LCKDSRQNWQKNSSAYKEGRQTYIQQPLTPSVFRRTVWRNFDEDIARLLIKYEIDDEPQFENGQYALSLEISDDDDWMIPKFLEHMWEYKFDIMKSITIENLEDLQAPSFKSMNRFMKYWYPNSLDTLCIKSSMTEIGDLRKGLTILLPSVRHQVFLECFKFDEETLKLVFESSKNAKELVLYWCQIGEISAEFHLDESITYALEVLDLYETAKKKEKDYLNKKSLKKLANAMAATSIKSSLRKVHVRAQFFKMEKAQKIFSKKGFILKVKANDKEPKLKLNPQNA